MPVLAQPVAHVNGRATVPSDLIWRLSVEQYHQMIRSGILTDDDPVELLDGLLVPKMPKNPPHRAATRLTLTALERVVPPGWYVDAQEPITTNDSEPEPDVSVVRGQTRDYLDRHPGPQDLAMLVEVSGGTLTRDQGSKKRVYAQARIPIYWIVNLVQRQVHVYSEPTGPGENPDYGTRQEYGPADEVPVVIDGREVGRIPVQDLLP